MFYLVIGFLVISSAVAARELVGVKAVNIILQHPEDTSKAGKNNDTRIIGGQPISIEEAPWQVGLHEDGELICGGSVISNLLILTAAHCVIDSRPSRMSVRAGSSYRQRGGQVRRVAKIFYDGSYNERTNNNDIAIIQLRKPLQINQFVMPVKLASTFQPPSGFASVTGWGVTREAAQNTSPILREVTVQFIPSNRCRNLYRKRNIPITANMVCAGATNGGRDACQGDSGGPLVEDGLQYGIVSMGVGCGRASFPGVYTSVARKLKWIKKAMAAI
ncbi:trypsin delta-like [Eupeodes corollae]|uniref:trypsin delta-like n=1 Tax=Eupeodes corollae TaxID=290404 RepID=UPI002490F41D|nr:trypsin delta-like [Eupeodes corollae]